jgi:2-polyprenyl-6-methoxyphenol hydroxylase-like FAD-dependent oxidoreductase
VLEKDASLKPYSRAILIPTRTLEIFREWYILDEFLQMGDFRPEFTVYEARTSQPLMRWQFDVLSDVVANPGLLFIPQDRTEQLLLDRVRSAELPRVEFGKEVVGFRPDRDGVTVEVRGPAGERIELRGRYLVGCDGAHSAVRHHLGLTLEGETYDVRMLLADVSLPERGRSLPTPRFATDRATPLALLRFDEARWRIIGSLHPGESEADAVTKESVAERLRALVGPGPFELQWASTFHIHRRNAPRFQVGRVFLAGDAAHLNSPAGGMGMNAGIQDVHNLAWKLAFALSSGGAESLLASYESERQSAVIRSVERVSDLVTRLMLYTPARVRRTLMRLFGLAGRIRPLRRRIVSAMMMLDTRYPVSVLIHGDRRWSGRIAPDCEVGRPGEPGRRLFDLTRGKPTIVSYDACAPAVTGFEAIAVAAAEGNAFRKTWNVRGPFAAVVRPDGFIGWAMQRPSPEAIQMAAARCLASIAPDVNRPPQ